MSAAPARRSVPCGDCRACCRDELVILHPESGDDPSTYLTRQIIDPLSGGPALALIQNEDGRCIYLGDEGCRIHDRAPAVCRGFDCRQIVKRLRQMMPRAEFEKMVFRSRTLQAGTRLLRKAGTR